MPGYICTSFFKIAVLDNLVHDLCPDTAIWSKHSNFYKIGKVAFKIFEISLQIL